LTFYEKFKTLKVTVLSLKKYVEYICFIFQYIPVISPNISQKVTSDCNLFVLDFQ